MPSGGGMLAPWRVGIKADGFQAIHCHNAVPARGEGPRVMQASHVGGLEIGRLLVDEQHKPNPFLSSAFQIGEETCQFEHGCDAAGIVVGARRALRAVVMRADDKNVRVGIPVAGSMMARFADRLPSR